MLFPGKQYGIHGIYILIQVILLLIKTGYERIVRTVFCKQIEGETAETTANVQL